MAKNKIASALKGLFSMNTRKDNMLLKMWEEGKYLRVDEDIDNREIIKNGTRNVEHESK